jgi:hypothetical protein
MTHGVNSRNQPAKLFESQAAREKSNDGSGGGARRDRGVTIKTRIRNV